MNQFDQKELRSFLAALGLNIQQFETVIKPQPKQAEQPKQSGYEDMQELVKRVSKNMYGSQNQQGTGQSKEQADFQQVLNRLEKLEQNERKTSSSPIEKYESYISKLESHNQKLQNDISVISKEYDSIYKKAVTIEKTNEELSVALKKSINTKEEFKIAPMAFTKNSAELSRLVEENNELKQKLQHRISESIDNSRRMATEFQKQKEEIHNLKLDLNILGQENVRLIETIERIKNQY